MRATLGLGAASILSVGLTAPAASLGAQQSPAVSGTQVVLLGTGNPAPLPDRSGPATAIIVNGTAYLVDFGPGVLNDMAGRYSGRFVIGHDLDVY